MNESASRVELLELLVSGYMIYATIGTMGEGIQSVQLTKTQIKQFTDSYLAIRRRDDKNKIIQI